MMVYSDGHIYGAITTRLSIRCVRAGRVIPALTVVAHRVVNSWLE